MHVLGMDGNKQHCSTSLVHFKLIQREIFYLFPITSNYGHETLGVTVRRAVVLFGK